jgi:predicted DsbA family dithiol-disulfide isomerase
LRNNFEIEVQWRAFPLHPEIPEAGISLKGLYASRNIDMSQAVARLQSVAEELGLPLGERKNTYNSRRAQQLGKWAESLGMGDKFHDAVFRAYFVDCKNIAKTTVLAAIVKGIGLPEQKVEEVLRKGTFMDAVDSDWNLSHRLRISCVPTFVVDDESVEGAQPYEVLEHLLLKKGIKRK